MEGIMSDTQNHNESKTTTRTTKDGTQVTETRNQDGSVHAETRYPDGSVKVIDQYVDTEGTTHASGTRTNADGSVDTHAATRTTNPDGSTTTQQTHTEQGGKVTVEKTDIARKDGTTETEQTRTVEGGDTRTTHSKSSADGKQVTETAERTDAQGKTTTGEASKTYNDDGSTTTTRKIETDEGGTKTTVTTEKDGQVLDEETTVVHPDKSKTIDKQTVQDDGTRITSHTEVDNDGNAHTDSARTTPDGKTEVATGDREVVDGGNRVDTRVVPSEDGGEVRTRQTTTPEGDVVSNETFDPDTGLWTNDDGETSGPNGDTYSGITDDGVLVDLESGDTFDTTTGDRHVAGSDTTFHHDKNSSTGQYENKGTWESSDGAHGTFSEDVFEGETEDGETFRASGDLVGPADAADAGPDEPILTLETGNKNDPNSHATSDYYENGGVTTSYANGDTFSRDGSLINEILGLDPNAQDFAPGTNTPDAELDELAADTYDSDREFDDLIEELAAGEGLSEAAEASDQAAPSQDSSSGTPRTSEGSDDSGSGSQQAADDTKDPAPNDDGSENTSDQESEDDADAEADGDEGGSENDDNSTTDAGGETDESTQEEPEDTGGESEQGDGGIAGGQDFDPDKIREELGMEEVPESDPWDDPSFEALAQPGEGQSGATPEPPIDIDAPDGEVSLPDWADEVDPNPDPLDLLGQPASHENDAIDAVNAFDADNEHYEQVSNPGWMTADTEVQLEADVGTAFGAGSEIAQNDEEEEEVQTEPEVGEIAAPSTPAFESSIDQLVSPDVTLDLEPSLNDDVAQFSDLGTDSIGTDIPLDDLTLEG